VDPGLVKLAFSTRIYQAAEKLDGRGKKCQGTNSVVPEVPQNQRGLLAAAGLGLRFWLEP